MRYIDIPGETIKTLAYNSSGGAVAHLLACSNVAQQIRLGRGFQGRITAKFKIIKLTFSPRSTQSKMGGKNSLRKLTITDGFVFIASPTKLRLVYTI